MCAVDVMMMDLSVANKSTFFYDHDSETEARR